MCGRLVIHFSPEELYKILGITMEQTIDARYNIAYGEHVIVALNENGVRKAEMMEWGLTPSWVKPPIKELNLFHARAETITEKPSFREAVKNRRCVIPISSFYDWEEKGTYKQPWNMSLPDESVMVVAGVWDEWKNPITGTVKRGWAMVTVEPNEEIERIHDRMPVVLQKEQIDIWLDSDTTLEDALSVLQTYHGDMKLIPVSREVNSVRSEGEHLIAPITDDNKEMSLFD